jgi:DNA-binding response OmpR family regulator
VKKRLLVIDDDLDILEALSLVLEESYEVVSTTDGVDALRQLQRRHFDAAVVDLMMPEMDGESLVDSMRQIGIKVPVLLASAVPDLAGRAARLGLPCIAKPYDMPVLEAKLAAVLGATG